MSHSSKATTRTLTYRAVRVFIVGCRQKILLKLPKHALAPSKELGTVERVRMDDGVAVIAHMGNVRQLPTKRPKKKKSKEMR
mgnify:CR=1 FL=1